MTGPGPLLDSHCHLDDAAFDPDRAACLARASAVGVGRVLVPGLHAGQWPGLRLMARRLGLLYAVGTHPYALPDHPPGDPWLPDDAEDAAAVGECGLDANVAVPMDHQIQVLEAHLAFARARDLPVILHCWKAHPTLLSVLRRWAPVRGVVHAYSGGAELVRDYVAVGLHLSFGGAITWDGARRPIASLRRVPLDRLLLETDGPDQCPRPHRGRGEPAYLVDVLRAAEGLRGEPLSGALRRNAAALGWG